MSALKDRLLEDVKTSMKSQDRPRLSVLRLVQAAIKQREVDERILLNDDQVTVTLNKMIKQRRDSIEQYQQGGRQDLVDQETYEIKVIETYLPALLSSAETEEWIARALTETGAKNKSDLGKAMKFLKENIPVGQANFTEISQALKDKLI